jgi:ribosomal subunit interface protein
VDIVVKGRNVEVPEHYRQHVAEKLHKIERYDQKIIRVDVELSHERNPRQSGSCQRVEITCISRGPSVRAEACAGDFYSALDSAIAKFEARLRRMADRRRVHRGRHAPISVAAATSGLPLPDEELFGGGPRVAAESTARAESAGTGQTPVTRVDHQDAEVDEHDDQPWHIVREKEHDAAPMTVDDALFQMELVGHDFFLFLDKESGRPSVVYRRRAYDYGVIAIAA